MDDSPWTPEREAAARARCEAATAGPWVARFDEDGGTWEVCAPAHEQDRPTWYVVASACGHRDLPDAELAAHARTDLPAALEELARVRAERDDARARLAACEGERDRGASLSEQRLAAALRALLALRDNGCRCAECTTARTAAREQAERALASVEHREGCGHGEARRARCSWCNASEPVAEGLRATRCPRCGFHVDVAER